MAAPTKPRPGEPIKLVTTSTGEARYRVVLDGPPHADGKRRQVRSTHRTLTEARDFVSAHRSDRTRGVLVAPDKQTFSTYADKWLANRSRRVRETTARSYRGCLDHGVAVFGTKQLPNVTRSDVETVVSQLVAEGRSKRRAQLVLFVLSSVFDDALHDGLIVRNPAARVEAAGKVAKDREALSAADLAKLRKHFAGDSLEACWLLTLAGLRRSELLGLMWSDVDLSAKSLTIQRSRVDVDGKRTAIGPPKTRRGLRTLPIPSNLLVALKMLRQSQLADFGGEQVRTGYVCVDLFGQPMRPERWSDLWREHSEAAKVPVLSLHCARHSSVTAMIEAGVQDHVVAAWHGHDLAVMRGTYLHAGDAGLVAAGEALEATYGE